MIKVSVIHCSTRANGRTAFLSKAFIKGLKETKNLEIKEYQLSEWKLKPCIGNSCSQCWFKNGGTCIIDDDFTKNINKISKSNFLIFTSPIYLGNATHLFKLFTERLYSIIKPYFVKNGLYYGHSRISEQEIKIFLISTCALPGVHNFQALIKHLQAFDYLGNFTYYGEILKPSSLELQILDAKKRSEIEKKCYMAGKNLTTNPSETMYYAKLILDQEMDTESYINYCNSKFKNLIDTKD